MAKPKSAPGPAPNPNSAPCWVGLIPWQQPAFDENIACCVLFCRKWSIAHRLIDEGHVRCNGRRVCRASQPRIVQGGRPRHSPINVLAAQQTRLHAARTPAEAQLCYRVFDPQAETP
jgi:ribosomal 50S subunit-recycling heat shock protein